MNHARSINPGFRFPFEMLNRFGRLVGRGSPGPPLSVEDRQSHEARMSLCERWVRDNPPYPRQLQ